MNPNLFLITVVLLLITNVSQAVEIGGTSNTTRADAYVGMDGGLDGETLFGGDGGISLGNHDISLTATAARPGVFGTAAVGQHTFLYADDHHLTFEANSSFSTSISSTSDAFTADGQIDSYLNFGFTTDETLKFTLQADLGISQTGTGGSRPSEIDVLFGPVFGPIYFSTLPSYSASGMVSGRLQPGSYRFDLFAHAGFFLGSVGGSYSVTLTLAPQPITTSVASALRFAIIPEITAPNAAGGFSSKAQLLDGTASVQRDVSVEFLPPVAGAVLASDVVDVHGTATDVFVLQLTYNEAAAISLFGSEASAILGWLDPADGMWKNAVLGNAGGTPNFVGDRAYDPLTDFVLGDYGVDTANNHVWAVLDHNSQFAATPEPASAVLLLGGGALLALRRRRSAAGV